MMNSCYQLSIVTINRNNATGLEETIKSVVSQTCTAFEYVVVDGASSDDSVEVIRRYAPAFGERIKWISEPDKGIYNAMNKGICMATGEYIQILNSGDCLASGLVLENMLAELGKRNMPSILYGNMIKCFPDGRRIVDKCFAGQGITLLGMYSGTLNHDPAFIRHVLFEKYGLYDESLRIASDWKWYLQAIILGKEIPVYVDIDVTLFDMRGISEKDESKASIKFERDKVLAELIPDSILSDYTAYSKDIYMMRRIHRHPLVYKIVLFLERFLFKIEKHQNRINKVQKWG